MENNHISIRVENVSKQYRLGAIGGTTLRDDLQRLSARIRGKEDPTSKVGTQIANSNETFLALQDINFEIKQGERVGIIGHNGAGKSTLLKLLSRVTAPTTGSIKYNGRIASMLEVGTGFHPELTGRENVYMNGAILGMTKAEIDSKFDEIVAFAEMEKFIDTPVKRYSSGMYVKLAFAVAAHLDSEILIMDEVLAVGDMKFQQKCLGKMDDVSKSDGRTILYVSHNMNTIRQLCDRCIVLDHGKVVLDGSVEDGIRRYMANNEGAMKKYHYLKGTSRLSADFGVKAHITSFTFVNSDSCVYDRKVPIRAQVEWEANEALQDLRFLFEIRSAGGAYVAAAESEIVGSCQKGEKKSATVELDVSTLVEGKYFFVINIYSVNEMGGPEVYDHPTKSIYFELINLEPYSIAWLDVYWGHSRLHRMKVIESD